MTFLRTHWRTISTAMLVATALSAFGMKAYAAMSPDDCCASGAPCCHPGAPCCNHGAKH